MHIDYDPTKDRAFYKNPTQESHVIIGNNIFGIFFPEDAHGPQHFVHQPELIKKIRGASGLTQKEFAEVIQVSTVLVSMIEAGQKDVSKNFIIKLSEKLEVNPSSITPFLYIYKDIDNKDISKIEKTFIDLGEKLQYFLINQKAKNLKKYVRSK